MVEKSHIFLKDLPLLLVVLITFTFTLPTHTEEPPIIRHTHEALAAEEPIIIGHTCTDITHLPKYWVEKAKSQFGIAYGHTSHGSQIVSGMEVLMVKSDIYSFNHDGSGGALSLHDTEPQGDLGNPDRTSWAQRTRALLNTPGCDRNMIIWSWCGQANTTEANINLYLNLMNKLEKDYPDVTFVYMTGHLNGTGEEGNLNIRNNQIRQFCLENNKILFDFADIESYDPDGDYFLDKYADDGCNYVDNGVKKNWAEEWCAAHPGECSSCNCAHSKSLNCDLKGRAFWWMMARLAGWNPADCDYNSDGTIDKQDLIDITDVALDEYDKWLKDCWEPRKECGDFNGDGIIDSNDILEKRKSVIKGLTAWMQNCGFQNGRNSRQPRKPPKNGQHGKQNDLIK